MAQHILDTLPGSADVEDRWRAALAPCGQMRHAAAERYATGAAETLAPAVVAAAIEASTDSRGRVNDVILTVASYGRRLPEPAQVRYAELAALEIEQARARPGRLGRTAHPIGHRRRRTRRRNYDRRGARHRGGFGVTPALPRVGGELAKFCGRRRTDGRRSHDQRP